MEWNPGQFGLERRKPMAWDLDSDRPIYAQLVERLQVQIVSGYYPPGGKLPSVRELASVAAVNPNTMQKALVELERQGFLYTQRTSGRFVKEDISQRKLREEQAQQFMKEFTEKMLTIGYDNSELVEIYEKYIKEEYL